MDTNLKNKTLYKSNKNKMLDGVCAGIGEYLDIDPNVIRLAFVVLCIFAFGGLIAYIVAAIIVPRAPEGYDPKAAADTKPHTHAAEKTASAGTTTDETSADTSDSVADDAPPTDTPTML